MTDKELLEYAAKAAGIEIDYSETNGGGIGNTGFDMLGNAMLDWHNGERWNPLTDDGDALRLAAKCQIDIDYNWHSKYVRCVYPEEPIHVEDIKEDLGKDPYAATRRAIVRAAAEIGRAQP